MSAWTNWLNPAEKNMHVEQQAEHKWLEQLVGEWESEMEAAMGPDQPPVVHKGTETVRSLSVWVLCEGLGAEPLSDGKPAITLMTLGYDSAMKRFVGSFIGSMMTNIWIYDGELDATGKILTLAADGPSFTDPTKSTKYLDAIEIRSPDHRILTSRFLGEDGNWHQFMTMHYRRKK